MMVTAVVVGGVRFDFAKSWTTILIQSARITKLEVNTVTVSQIPAFNLEIPQKIICLLKAKQKF